MSILYCQSLPHLLYPPFAPHFLHHSLPINLLHTHIDVSNITHNTHTHSVQEALFQLGTIYERRGATDPAQLEQAAKTFEMLLNKVPGDPNLCSRLGEMRYTCHTSPPPPFFMCYDAIL